MKILVCDDQEGRCRQIVATIQRCGVIPAGDITSLVENHLTTALEELFDRVRSCLAGSKDGKAIAEVAFDKSYDLVILDNNLTELDIRGARLTAEAFIGYVRSFTEAPYIVSLNKNHEVDFDLQYLIGDYGTAADVALNTRHLENAALWTGKSSDAKKADGFLPWYWPALTLAGERRRKQIAFIKERLDQPLLGTLGFPTDEDSLGFLSLHAKGALSPQATADDDLRADGIALTELTFREAFAGMSRSLPDRDREQLATLAAAGDAYANEVIARAVAADIDLWFRRDVLGPQEMLVDLPHLLTRMPFLLGDHANSIQAWNSAVTRADPSFGMMETLYQEHVAPARFAHDIWVSHPAFWWPSLKANSALSDLFFSPSRTKWANAVFTEDCSVFAERSEDDTHGPVEFATELEGPWARRYVARIDGFNYAPRSAFAIG